MSSKLEQLKAMTQVVADTGDIEAIAKYQPQDATTNPSLLLKAAALPHYQELINKALQWSANSSDNSQRQLENCCDKFAVDIGCEILQVIPGRISTEVDARLSFDTAGTVTRALKLIDMYADQGIGKNRILIKIASTWEGIRAAEQLERQGINCNLTLLFSLEQAAACAEAGAYLISPFVGRILDWYVANSDSKITTAAEDPGVQSVVEIYNYYKSRKYSTVVMGASFRNVGEIEALAGCDRLTISPPLLDELASDFGQLEKQLDTTTAKTTHASIIHNESEFRCALNNNAMATEKLAEGIRNFVSDQIKLEALLLAR
jgi:transaldolase